MSAEEDVLRFPIVIELTTEAKEKGAEGFEASQPKPEKEKPESKAPVPPPIKTTAGKPQELVFVEQLLKERDEKIELLSQNVEGLNTKITEIGGLASNPLDAASGKILEMVRGLGPHGQAFVAGITGAIIAPKIAAEVIQLLATKGGPLNNDYHDYVVDELTGIFSKEVEKARVLGIDTVINSQDSGFQPISGTDVYNSLYRRTEDRIIRIGQDEKAKGIA